MRQNIRDLAVIVNETLPLAGPIYKFGAFQVPDQIHFADLRPLFPGREYVGCDMREGVGVDKILDLHAIDLPSESVGSVLCFDTLEHVEYPGKSLEELHRILEPSGIVVISSVMNFPIHDHPHDYWRFTPEAFWSILKPFASSFVGFQGDALFPHTVIGVGFKGQPAPLDEFRRRYERRRENGRTRLAKSHLSHRRDDRERGRPSGISSSQAVFVRSLLTAAPGSSVADLRIHLDVTRDRKMSA